MERSGVGGGVELRDLVKAQICVVRCGHSTLQFLGSSKHRNFGAGNFTVRSGRGARSEPGPRAIRSEVSRPKRRSDCEVRLVGQVRELLMGRGDACRFRKFSFCY
jgi:hypothetical protein